MNNILQDGYIIVPQAIDNKLLTSLKIAIVNYTSKKADYGIRDLHLKIPIVKDLVYSDLILNILKKYLHHQKFKIIKSIFFNKNINYNWSVGWHQDKTIAVENKVNLPGFKNWKIKQGVPHVQPPLDILEKITTIRIALDNTDKQNGALKIIPLYFQ